MEKIIDKRRGITFFRRKFCPTVPKNFVGGTLVFQKCSGIENFLDNRGITILSKFFLSHSAEKIREGTLLCFRKFLVRKKIMDKTGDHDFSSKNLSQSAEKFREGTLSCFRKFLVWKKLWIREGDPLFSLESFCLRVPKKIVGEHRKFFCLRISRFSVRGVPRFSVDYFMSHDAETFVGEPFSVSLISGIEKFYAQEEFITIFCRKFFVSQYQKIS